MSPAFKSIVIPLSEVPYDEMARDDVAYTGELREPIVLVVDDEQMVADTLTLIFKRAGLCTLTAYDAQSALHMASAVPPDLLVSDVDMPGMNGVGLALSLLSMVPECRVLLFSGHATAIELAPAREAGHDFPLLPKPVHPDVMLENVSRCLGRGWAMPRSMPRSERPARALCQPAGQGAMQAGLGD